MSPTQFAHRFLKHRYGLTLLSFLTAAGITGVACVGFMKGFEFVLDRRLDFTSIGPWAWIVTPVVFLISIELVRRIAPCAAGTGIPQTIFAAEHMSAQKESALTPLVSPLTLVVKIVSLLLAVWVGASTGREGPTVHVATCVFLLVLRPFRKGTGLTFDIRSAIVAGGAAGLAAAFNTPLAGVTFAIEELSSDYFASIKDFVLLAIIVAAIAAKSLTGEYTYFGKLLDPPAISLLSIILIGIGGGLLGAMFSTAILKGQSVIVGIYRKKEAWKYVLPLVFSFALLISAAWFGTRVLGPGNQVAQALVEGKFESWVWYFPLTKIASTLFTYWSGIAGGIFAPCLSVGAALGADIGQLLHMPVASCALIGMAAFLSGTIQAPITSFVIIFEMTGHHQMLLPVMLCSLISFMTAHLSGAKHLYKSLAENYKFLLN